MARGADFSVMATGTATLLYQRRRDGVDVAGATSRTLSLASITPASAGLYSVMVSNTAGAVTSASARLTVNILPTITTPPSQVTVSVGGTASFSVGVSGTAPFTYQWQKGTTIIPGATGSFYTIPSAQTTDAGNYRVVVTNAAGTVTSASASLTVLVPPAITTQPVDATKNGGQNITFSVTATGSATLTYQWQLNGINIVGATSRTLALTAVTSANEGLYRAVVTNGAGSITSSEARLMVIIKPTITTQPVAVTASVGGTASFSVATSGTAPMSYQWRRNGPAIAGATSSTLTLTNILKTQAGNYSVVISNAAGSVTSGTASLVVN